MQPLHSSRTQASGAALPARARVCRTLASGLAIACALALAACGGRHENSSTSTTVSNRAISSFAWAFAAAPNSLDLAKDGLIAQDAKIMSLVTEPLVRQTLTAGSSPNLAVRVREPTPTTLVYDLRPGVRFSDGTRLAAADVAWSLQHVTAPTSATASPLSGTPTVTVTGPHQVTVKFAAYEPSDRVELNGISYIQEASFAKAHAANLGSPGALPIGTGPYRYESVTPQSIILVRNPHYWGAKPLVAKLVFPVIPQDTSAQLAMRQGSLQSATVGDLRTVKAWQGIAGATLHPVEDLTSNLLSFDTSRPPFDDLHLRLAIAYSFDRTAIAANAFGKRATLLQALIPPSELVDVAPSPSALQRFLSGLPAYGLDPAKAKAELKQSRYPQGLAVTIPYRTDVGWEPLAILNLAQNMKPLGIKIIPHAESVNQWGQQLFEHQMRGVQVLPNFGAAAPDPNDVLGALTDPVLQPGHINAANWAPPAMVAARKAMLTSPNRDTRWEAVKTILSMSAAQVPYLPLFSAPVVYALAPGYTYTKPLTIFDLINGDWVDSLRATARS
jgi:peptide/nickel transport system substrate-binding protein